MPVGVPKVPFRIPGDEDASWVDVYNRLYRERFLFLGKEVDSEISNQIVGLMVYLSIEDKSKEQYLFINSPGGWVVPGIAIYDAMQFVAPIVHTICIGLAASMGSFLLVGGEITERLAFPHARVMIHQPLGSFYGTDVPDNFKELEEMADLYDLIVAVYVQRTGKPARIIYEDMERDAFMSATEAQAYGIVDLVGI
uniref:ATP-dependent Clp protease proteolytic subunit n=1 Tax=Malouetia tamaquarina TaxID=429269 RepID=A0A2S1U4F3_9GENT|nr:Clp protease proteolytic subunit [Malouetia tamaquarina]